jgi:hypothetical protein
MVLAFISDHLKVTVSMHPPKTLLEGNNLYILSVFQLIWTSCEGLPQYIVLDLRTLIKRPKEIRYIGFDFWHDYDSNPRTI